MIFLPLWFVWASLMTSNLIHTPLDRAAWHRPLVSIIITHYNYSDFISDAIRSVLDQTHNNWELVIVDDASSPEHRRKLEEILSSIRDDRVRYLPLPENVGQVLTFFAGFDQTTGDFVCLLDPDDRYAATFLEEALSVHLNEVVSCPIVSTDQLLLTKNGLISGGYRANIKLPECEKKNGISIIGDHPHRTYYIPANIHGWHWTSTSAMMFRRAAVNYLRPHKPLPFKRAFDQYMAKGSHMLGGTLFYTRPLVYRMVHERNAWHSNRFYSSFQRRMHPDAENWAEITNVLIRETLIRNNAPSKLPPPRGRLLRKLKRAIMKRLPNGKARIL